MGCISAKERKPKKPKNTQSKGTDTGASPTEPHGKERWIDLAEPGDIKDKYVLGQEIGRGGFSTVVEARSIEDDKKFAVKIVEKNLIKDDIKLLKREIEIMKQVKHDNILRLIEIFEDVDKVYIILELVEGSELFDRIVEKGYYSERNTINIVRQILSAVQYLHKMGIAHRDLKPENLLCSGNDTDETVKIADFGLSKMFSGDTPLTTSCGTPGYVAPEVLTQETYDKAVDMWGVGIITYILLAGYPPFYAENDAALFDKIINADYDFEDECWDDVSEMAKDFVRKLLVRDPNSRYTAEQAMQHPWMTSDNIPEKALKIHQKMSSYNLKRKEDRARQEKLLEDMNNESNSSSS